MNKKRTLVSLGGQEFMISAAEGEEYLRKIAQYVDNRIVEVQRAYPSVSVQDSILLCALNLSDELHKLKADYAALDKRIDQLRNLPQSDSFPKGPVKRPFESPIQK